MGAEGFAHVRTWLEGWCRVPPNSRWELDQFFRDAEEAAGGEVMRVDIVPQIIGLEYLNTKNEPSQRSVRVHTIAVSKKGAGLLQGYCQWRNAGRTFRLDRVVSVIDSDGEVHTPSGPFLRDMFSTYAIIDDPERATGVFNAFVNAYAAEFMVLKIMAGIDGEVLEEELLAIEDYAAQLMLRFDDQMGTEDVQRVSQWVRRLQPESGDLEDAFVVLENRPESELAMLCRAAKAVMIADGRHHPREVSLLEDLCLTLEG